MKMNGKEWSRPEMSSGHKKIKICKRFPLLIDKCLFPPHSIYNIYEIGITMMPNNSLVVLSLKVNML